MSRKYIEDKFNFFYEERVKRCEEARTMMKEMLKKERLKGHNDRITDEQADKMQDDLLVNLKKWYVLDEDWKQEIIEGVVLESNNDLLQSYKSVLASADYESTDEERFSGLVITLEFESRLLEAGFISE